MPVAPLFKGAFQRMTIEEVVALSPGRFKPFEPVLIDSPARECDTHRKFRGVKIGRVDIDAVSRIPQLAKIVQMLCYEICNRTKMEGWTVGVDAHGYARDPRFAPLVQLLLTRQDEQGRWLCGSVSRTWPLEKRNRPSKWVTLDGQRLLNRIRAATAEETD